MLLRSSIYFTVEREREREREGGKGGEEVVVGYKHGIYYFNK